MEDNPLVGTWKLVSYSCSDEDGNVDYPLGTETRGYITYTADGYMSVFIASADRANYASEDLSGGTVEENAAAATPISSSATRRGTTGPRVTTTPNG